MTYCVRMVAGENPDSSQVTDLLSTEDAVLEGPAATSWCSQWEGGREFGGATFCLCAQTQARGGGRGGRGRRKQSFPFPFYE